MSVDVVITSGIAMSIGAGVGALTGVLAGYLGGSAVNVGSRCLEDAGVLIDSPLANIAWESLGVALASRLGAGLGAMVALSICTGYPFPELKSVETPREVRETVEVSPRGDIHLSEEMRQNLRIEPGDRVVINSRKKTAILKLAPPLVDTQLKDLFQ